MELIKITTTKKGNAIVSARDLHEALGIGRDFTAWCKDMLRDDFKDQVDYHRVNVYAISKNGERNKMDPKPKTDYILRLNCAKEICMIQRSDIGRKIRQYFIECEEKLKAKTSVPSNYIEALKEVIRVEEEKQALLIQAELNKPKVEFYDAVASSTDTIDIGELAKVLNRKKLGRNKLFKFLREHMVLTQDNLPYQRYIEAGWFRVIEDPKVDKDGSVRIFLKTVVFQKGVDGINKYLNNIK